MKLILFALVLASIVFATDDTGCTENTAIGTSPEYRADFQFRVINEWRVTGTLLGLDYIPSLHMITGNNITAHKLFLYSPANGSLAPGALALSAGNLSSFGVVCNWAKTDSVIYTNDWFVPTLFKTTNGTTWTTVANPARTSGRGMDFDGTNYWSTQSAPTIGLWRFNPGVGQSFLPTPEITTQLSGLTTFPHDGHTGIAITTYSTHLIYFYKWDGFTLQYLGSGPCPAEKIEISCGLTYIPSNGYLYWSYRQSSSDYRLVAFAFRATSLDHSTWGAIKTSF